MKANSILIAIIIITIGLAACEKENLKNDDINENNSISIKEPPTTDYYEIITCEEEEGDPQSGYACVYGLYDECKQSVPCTPIDYPDGTHKPVPNDQLEEWGFTEAEMSDWEDGESVLENTDEFIEDHYDFYLHLHEETDVVRHPDTLMRNN